MNFAARFLESKVLRQHRRFEIERALIRAGTQISPADRLDHDVARRQKALGMRIRHRGGEQRLRLVVLLLPDQAAHLGQHRHVEGLGIHGGRAAPERVAAEADTVGERAGIHHRAKAPVTERKRLVPGIRLARIAQDTVVIHRNSSVISQISMLSVA